MQTIYRKLSAAVCLLLGTVVVSISPCRGKTISVPTSMNRSISEAMTKASSGDTVLVENGVYREHVLVAPAVVLTARTQFGAIIDGGGRGTVVTLAKNNTVSGFEIRNGTIGVFSNGTGNIVTNCRIVQNWQTGIIAVRHLPLIEDNIVAFNRASGFQGWDVRSTSYSINHNTFVYNGNHGIAVGGSSNILVENNIVAFNERFAIMLLDEAEAVRISNNNLYRNLASPGGIPKGNFSFDPAFMNARQEMDFRSNPSRCCQIKGTDNRNLGARLDY
jgi:parallel beta-helix repeat protein